MVAKNEKINKNELELTIMDRIVLLSLLPEQGHRMEIILYGEIKDKLKITMAEVEKYELKDVPGGGITGDASAAKDKKKFVFLKSEFELFKKILDGKESIGELNAETNKLYEMFCV